MSAVLSHGTEVLSRNRNEGDIIGVPPCRAAPKRGEVRSKRKHAGRLWKEAAAFYDGRRDASRGRARARLSVPRRDFTFRGRVSALVFSRGMKIQAAFTATRFRRGAANKLRGQLYGFAPLLAGRKPRSKLSRAHPAPPRSRRHPRAYRPHRPHRARGRCRTVSTGRGRHLIAVIVAGRGMPVDDGRGAAREK